ncbi:MAG: glycosyltransferase, partial [Bacteroidota bacterium]|nr:glycosyltransferase [Bacteroidota bacterium]
MNDSLVIIPTYNERENVVRMLETVMGLEFPFDVLVVDDGSPDGTAALVKECQVAHPDRIHLLERKGKLGLGTAYIAGFRWALECDYDFIFEMDCDFSHDPHDLVRLRIPCAEGGAGMSVGSRYVKGGSVANWPVNRM